MRSLYAAVNCRRPMRADGAWTSGSGRVGWPGDAPGATATGPFDLSMRELLLRPPYSISSAGRVSFHIDREGYGASQAGRPLSQSLRGGERDKVPQRKGDAAPVVDGTPPRQPLDEAPLRGAEVALGEDHKPARTRVNTRVATLVPTLRHRRQQSTRTRDVSLLEQIVEPGPERLVARLPFVEGGLLEPRAGGCQIAFL